MQVPNQDLPDKFPPNREEFAGELTPDILPGPVTRQHKNRFRWRDRSRPDPPDPEDPGVK